jgi:hypothetical protein
MATAQLGPYSFRISPSQVFFTYEVDTVVIPTVGGRVVQVYGITMGDVTVQGLFGQQRDGGGRDSWELAEEFQAQIASLVGQQSKIPTGLQIQGRDPTPMHQPFRFVYNDDTPETRAAGLPVHNWDLMVYIKDLKDVSNAGATIEHATGKYSYGYTLTLFVVEDNSRILKEAAINKFIDRLATGVGWQRTRYNGPMDKAELEEYLKANSTDGTIHGLVLKQFNDASEGKYFAAGSATTPVPGGAATANDAKTFGAGTPSPSTDTGSGTRVGSGGTF